MIIAIVMARNEAETIGQVISHLRANGVTRVIVEDGHSTDDTYNVAIRAGAVVLHEHERAYDQSARLTLLASLYAEPGDWVLCPDADEWWIAPGAALDAALDAVDAPKVYAQMFLHRDWEWRRPDPKPLMKVAFRWQPGARIADGCHNVAGVEGPEICGPFEIREIQYRSWEHFLAKIDKTRELLANSPNLDPRSGTHMKALVAMTPEELEAEWASMQEGPWIHDPIPAAPPFDPQHDLIHDLHAP